MCSMQFAGEGVKERRNSESKAKLSLLGSLSEKDKITPSRNQIRRLLILRICASRVYARKLSLDIFDFSIEF